MPYPKLSRTNLAVKGIADAVGYRGRSIYLADSGNDRVTIDGTYWSGGRRTTWHAFDTVSGQLVTMPNHAPEEYGGRQSDYVDLDRLPTGVVLVEEIQGSWKALYLHPSTNANGGLYPGSAIGSAAQLRLGTGAVAS